MRSEVDGSLIPPSGFLPAAERFGLMAQIDCWVVSQAVELIAAHARAGKRLSLCVNLSGLSMADCTVASHIDDALAASGIDPSCLVFEVTETAAIGNIDAAIAFSERLRRRGCRFALDDFGAGYASFYYLSGSHSTSSRSTATSSATSRTTRRTSSSWARSSRSPRGWARGRSPSSSPTKRRARSCGRWASTTRRASTSGDRSAWRRRSARHSRRVPSFALRDGYAELGSVRLHYVEAGEGPLVVLLHGFPEFWYGWRAQIEPLAASGLRVVAPDLRGYNLSSKPSGVAAYDLEPLAADVADLIEERGAERAYVAGHDWGGAVAWATAMLQPRGRRAARDPERAAPAPVPRGDPAPAARPRSPGTWASSSCRGCRSAARRRMFRYGLSHDPAPGAFTAEDLERYEEAWSQPGALTAFTELLPRALAPDAVAAASGGCD